MKVYVLNKPVEVVLSPTVEVDTAEVARLSGMGGGPEVVRVRVEGGEGLCATFWVSVHLNRQGRPVATLSTSPSAGRVVRRSVTGTCSR